MSEVINELFGEGASIDEAAILAYSSQIRDNYASRETESMSKDLDSLQLEESKSHSQSTTADDLALLSQER